MPDHEKKRSIGVGIALVVIGLVVLIPSGLCTGMFGYGAIAEYFERGHADPNAMSLLTLALIFGMPFVLGSAVLIWFGIRLIQRR